MVNLDYDMESIQLCFVTIELYCHLLDLKMCGFYPAKAKCSRSHNVNKCETKCLYLPWITVGAPTKCNEFFHGFLASPFHQVSSNVGQKFFCNPADKQTKKTQKSLAEVNLQSVISALCYYEFL